MEWDGVGGGACVILLAFVVCACWRSVVWFGVVCCGVVWWRVVAVCVCVCVGACVSVCLCVSFVCLYVVFSWALRVFAVWFGLC